MKSTKISSLTLACLMGLSTHAFAAGIPVIDSAAIAQAIQQYSQLVQQLEQLKAQLNQAKQQYAAMTGGRGMENLLNDETRNVIPTNWQETLAQMNGGEISNLAKSIRDGAGLQVEQLSNLDEDTRALFEKATNSAVSSQASAGQVYDNASERFQRLQGLMTAIGSAQDPKAIEDLQARIGVESVMLQNEQIKMQALAQAAQAQSAIQQQQIQQQLLQANAGTEMPPLEF